MVVMAYQVGDIPAGVAWIRTLAAVDAVEQCRIFGLEPQGTLEANRVLLRNYIETIRGQSHRSVPEAVLVDDLDPDHGEQLRSGSTDAPGDTVEHQEPVFEARENPGNVEANPAWVKVINDTASAVGLSIARALVGQSAGSSGAAASYPSSRILQDIISRIPITNGSEPKKLVEFLVHLEKAQQLGLADQHSLVLLVLPRTAGQLRVVWTKAVADGKPIREVTRAVLDFFVPQRLRHTLIAELVYRVQRNGEPLLEFLSDIQDFSALLLPDLAGRELLEVALTGLSQQTRARMSGFPHPNCIEDLVALAPRIEVIARQQLMDGSDRPRFQGFSGSSRPQWRPPMRPNFSGISSARSSFRPSVPNHPGRNDVRFRQPNSVPYRPQAPRHQNWHRSSAPGSGSNPGRPTNPNPQQGNYRGRQQ